MLDFRLQHRGLIDLLYTCQMSHSPLPIPVTDSVYIYIYVCVCVCMYVCNDTSPLWCWGLRGSREHESYAGGSVATGGTFNARQVIGDDPDTKGCPGPPGWVLGVGLMTPPRKIPLSRNFRLGEDPPKDVVWIEEEEEDNDA